MVLEQLRRIGDGAAVIGSDGTQIGSVAEVHDDYVLVQAGTLLKHDLYVPVSSVSEVSADIVKLDVPAGEAEDRGWRFPPTAGLRRDGAIERTDEATDVTTMTGAGYGAGGGASSGGPYAPGHGDAIDDRLGGSGRAGLSGLSSRPEDNLAATADADLDASETERAGGDPDDADADHDDDDDEGDTSDDTSEGTSEDTSEGTSDDAPDQLV